MTKPTWQDYFLGLAKFIAAKSPDSQTKHGCVVCAKSNEILATGYNGFPRHLNNDESLPTTRPGKYPWMIHSEKNALASTRASKADLEGATAYVTGPPCFQCLVHLWQSGIKRVVHRDAYGYCKDKDVGMLKGNDDEEGVNKAEFLRQSGMIVEVVKPDLQWIVDVVLEDEEMRGLLIEALNPKIRWGYPPTADEVRQIQRQSFAFGNTSLGNPAITRELVSQASESLKAEGVGCHTPQIPCNKPPIPNKFKVGDRVRCIDATGNNFDSESARKGFIGVVAVVDDYNRIGFETGWCAGFNSTLYELVDPSDTSIKTPVFKAGDTVCCVEGCDGEDMDVPDPLKKGWIGVIRHVVRGYVSFRQGALPSWNSSRYELVPTSSFNVDDGETKCRR